MLGTLKKGVCPKKYSHETKYFIVVVAFCWRCLVLYFVLFLFLFLFLFFFGGGGGRGPLLYICFSFFSFLFSFSVFLPECFS